MGGHLFEYMKSYEVLHTPARCTSCCAPSHAAPPTTPGQVRFTPTVEHCSMATLIGLCIRVKLLRALPPRFKVGRGWCRTGGCLPDGWAPPPPQPPSPSPAPPPAGGRNAGSGQQPRQLGYGEQAAHLLTSFSIPFPLPTFPPPCRPT